PLNKNWYEKFNLEQQLFYRLRFSEQAIHKEYISFQQKSFYQKVAQFAPYVIENGKSVPIFMIYCNRNLVYYYETDNNTPYSFAGKEGYNSIVLRTREHEYQIDSVLLKKGHKLEFSIPARGYAKNITKRIRPDSLTKAERNLLKGRMLLLRQDDDMPSTYLWQDTFAIHYFSAINQKQNSYPYKKEPLIFGPFLTQSHIQLLQPSRLGAKFSFEPGFEYEVESRRERLYHSNHFNRKMVLPRYRDYKMPMDSLIKTSRLRYQQQPKINGTRLSKDYKNIINEGGSFQFTFQDSLNHLVAIALKNDSSSTIKQFVPSLRRFSKLSSSTYTLLLVNQNFQTFCYHFEAKKDTLLFTNINYPSWQATADSILQKWFPSDQIISPENPFLSLEEKVLPLNFMNSREIRGQVTDSNSGEPLIYASVLIKGANIGTTTDLDGYYSILIPDEIENPVLEVMYTGYESEEVPVSYGRLVDIALEEGTALGQEILVVAYSPRPNLSLSSALQGRTTGVRINTKSSISNPKDNIKIGGLAYDPLVNGRYLISQFSDSTSTIENESSTTSSRIRSNFQDYAYWNPNLMTDQNGEAYFTVTYPDNITSWNTFVVGMDKKLRAGVAYGNTKSYKPLLAQLATPRFLVESDESDLIGKAVNYTKDTLSITTKFELAGKEIQSNSTDLVDGFVEKIKVDAPDQSDSLHFQYQLQMGDYFDGEKRSIPVVRRGVEAVKG
ncbi:MAG: alpha-2-macroglobulin family protein, partial [Bacteroidota bacterium]